MNAPTSLPKDVGLCAKCNATNSKHVTRCRECGTVLPWAEQKLASQQANLDKKAQKMQQSLTQPMSPPITPGQAYSPPSQTFNPAAPTQSRSLSLDSIDIGGTIIAGLLYLLVFVASFICPFLGFRLYRYFDSEENNLQYAAGAALGMWALVFFAWIFAAQQRQKNPPASSTTITWQQPSQNP